MSVQAVRSPRHECSRDDCEEEFPQPNAVEGSFCSRECATLVRGESLLSHIRRDHRFCHSCFRQLKEIERPTVEFLRTREGVATSAIVGFEYLTEDAELGPANRVSPHVRNETSEDGGHTPAPADVQIVSGTTCSCGTTDHRDAYLRESELTSIPRATVRLCEVLAMLGQEGQHDKRIDAQSLVMTLRESAQEDDVDGLDWRRAVGEAVVDE